MSDNTDSIGTDASYLESISVGSPEKHHLYDEALTILKKGNLSKQKHDDLKKYLLRLRAKGELDERLTTITKVDELLEYVKSHQKADWLQVRKKPKPKHKNKTKKSKQMYPGITSIRLNKHGKVILTIPTKMKTQKKNKK
jgi:hypothetical protein